MFSHNNYILSYTINISLLIPLLYHIGYKLQVLK
nr:MAG TPA: hypothetical protein [Caudoviricetes sp.]